MSFIKMHAYFMLKLNREKCLTFWLTTLLFAIGLDLSLYSSLVSLWNRLFLYCFLPSCFHFTCNPRVNAFCLFLLLCIKQILCGLSNTICCFVLLYQKLYMLVGVRRNTKKKDGNGVSKSLDDFLSSPWHLT